MKLRRQQLQAVINRIIVLLLLLILVGVLLSKVVIVNTTNSVERGIYLIRSKNNIMRYSFVAFCPPDNEIFRIAKHRGYIASGYCENGYSRLIKQVYGMPGDIYQFTEDGLKVNGRLLANTKPLLLDKQNLILPKNRAAGKLKQGEYILMGTNVYNSFDARYFGVIDGKQIVTVVELLTVFGENK